MGALSAFVLNGGLAPGVKPLFDNAAAANSGASIIRKYYRVNMKIYRNIFVCTGGNDMLSVCEKLSNNDKITAKLQTF